MISGTVFHILGICDGGGPSKKSTGTKEKMPNLMRIGREILLG